MNEDAGASPGAAAAIDRRQRDRRSGDRRRTERRSDGAISRLAQEIVHGRPGPGGFRAWSAAEAAWPGEAGADARGERGGEASGDSATSSALARIVRTYVAARAVIGIALVVALTAAAVAGARLAPVSVLICLAFAMQAALLWLLPRFRALTESPAQTPQRQRQWAATIGVDLVAFGLLHAFDAGATLNFAALLVLPVLMSGVLTPRLLALGVAASVALLLLTVAASHGTLSSDGGVLALAQSGLAGIGLFVVALLGGELAGRLVREEESARGSREQARQQAQLNRLVIEEMTDGVLVVDAGLQVRAANPAGRRLLAAGGIAGAAPFALRASPAWGQLADAVEQALATRHWPEGGRELPLHFADGFTRVLQVRVRFTRRPAESSGDSTLTEDFCVLLMEDVRTAQARLRQDKLAAMGRMSAGVAHEIRNPLAAIAQANALLLEDELAAPQARLARMVADNVRRLERIIEDVLEVAPGVPAEAIEVDARAVIAAATDEWAATSGIALGFGNVAGSVQVRADLPQTALPVTFDPEHLRRVLVNLLDNAVRHASGGADAVLLRLAVRDDASAVLSVASDGEAIPPEVERHLFEPFFSTRSRGTGLGLYICRELCERYGASIEYRPRAGADRHRKGFVVVMRRSTNAHRP